eukprot:218383-Rhodomonas_salina.2
MIFLPEAISSTTLSVLIQYQHPLTPFLRQNCAWGPMPTHAQSCELLQGRGGEQTSGKFEVIAGAGGKFVAPLLGGMAHQMRGQRKFRRGNQCMKGVLVVGLVSLLGLSLLPEAHALNRKVNRDEGAGVEEGSIPVSCNTYNGAQERRQDEVADPGGGRGGWQRRGRRLGISWLPRGELRTDVAYGAASCVMVRD